MLLWAAQDGRCRYPARRLGGERFFRAFACTLLLVELTLGSLWAQKNSVAARENVTNGQLARVVILSNANMPESVRLAEYYARVRGIPRERIVALPLSGEETVSWREFVTTLWQPFQELCMGRGWIEAIAMTPMDAAGRRKHVVFEHSIDYLVICRGVPLRIAHDPALVDEKELLANGKRQEFATNQASVDNELALVGVGAGPIMGFVPNPLYGAGEPSLRTGPRVVKVMRLDGPDWDSARSLVDQAIAGERYGIIGQAYVDMGGPYSPGEAWFEEVVGELSRMGFPLVVDRRPTLVDQSSRFDAPVMYFGWYSDRVDGAFKLPGLRLPAGALAYHLHSHSANTLRDAGKGWAGPLAKLGAAGTLGNVYEPYLVLTQHPALWLKHLLRGGCLGDAGYYAMPALSWQTTLLGDPLYRPFGVSFERQWNERALLPAHLRPYVVMRKMLLLEVDRKADEALRLGLAELDRQPSLPLGLAVAERLRRAQRYDEAIRSLAFAGERRDLSSEEWGLCHEIALELEVLGDHKLAFCVVRNLLMQKWMPSMVRRVWLPDGIRLARKAGGESQGLNWEQELADLLH